MTAQEKINAEVQKILATDSNAEFKNAIHEINKAVEADMIAIRRSVQRIILYDQIQTAIILCEIAAMVIAVLLK